MEQENQVPKKEEQKAEKKKLTWKDWLIFIGGMALLVSIKPILRAVMGNSSSSSSSSNIQIDLDIPESEPIDYEALFDEAFEESKTTE